MQPFHTHQLTCAAVRDGGTEPESKLRPELGRLIPFHKRPEDDLLGPSGNGDEQNSGYAADCKQCRTRGLDYRCAGEHRAVRSVARSYEEYFRRERPVGLLRYR